MLDLYYIIIYRRGSTSIDIALPDGLLAMHVELAVKLVPQGHAGRSARDLHFRLDPPGQAHVIQDAPFAGRAEEIVGVQLPFQVEDDDPPFAVLVDTVFPSLVVEVDEREDRPGIKGVDPFLEAFDLLAGERALRRHQHAEYALGP